MRNIILAICIIMSITLSAQDSTMIFIKAGSDLSDVLTPDKIYQRPEFVNGKVLFRNGSASAAKLNYNLLNGEIEFIAPNNDTLAIAKNQILDIKKVVIDSQTFVYHEGYLELVTESGLGKLFKKQVYVVFRREKMGGYNQPISTAAIESYGSYVDNQGNFYTGLKVRENITLALRTTYYISNQYDLFLPATKPNMMDLYRTKKEQVRSYLNKNKVDFKNGEDLKKMFDAL